MGKIVWSVNLTLDGVVQDPDGAEESPRGGWFRQYGGADLEQWQNILEAHAMATDALLLGRRSDEWFGSRWNDREGAWADRLRAVPKYVVSSTATATSWRNGTVLSGEVITEVTRLKTTLDGELVVFASYQLGNVLLEHGLIDELRLFVFPVVLGSGDRLFASLLRNIGLRLLGSETIGDNMVSLTYEVIPDA